MLDRVVVGELAPSFQEPSRENSLGVGTLARAEIWCSEPSLTFFTLHLVVTYKKMVTLPFNLNEVCQIIYWIDDPVVVISLNH